MNENDGTSEDTVSKQHTLAQQQQPNSSDLHQPAACKEEKKEGGKELGVCLCVCWCVCVCVCMCVIACVDGHEACHESWPSEYDYPEILAFYY